MMKPEVSFCGERTSPPSGLAPRRTSSAWRAPSAASAPPHAWCGCSASPLPACFPCHHSFVFSPISPHPHLLPQKKSQEKKRKEKEEVCTGAGLGACSLPFQWVGAASFSMPSVPGPHSVGHAVTVRGRPVHTPSPLRRPLGKARVFSDDQNQCAYHFLLVSTVSMHIASCDLICEAHYSKYSTVVVLGLKSKKLNESYLQKCKL